MREETHSTAVHPDLSAEELATAEAAPAPASRISPTLGAAAALAAAGAATGTAYAENLMKPLMPRGFSISNPSASTLPSTPENEATATAPITVKAAARFLAQATMGTKKADIARVQALGGYSSWISDQLRMQLPTSVVSWLISKQFTVEDRRFDPGPFTQAVWRLMILSNGQLRQRVAFALSNIFVINANSLNMAWPAFAAGNFHDILSLNAFGNFRTLLEKVTLSSAMGAYLNMRGNYKADPSRRTEPDENYAREVLQLFTIGLFELNQDGTPKLTAGVPIDTYKQQDISGLARVLTGWDCDDSSPGFHKLPMVHYADRHETGVKTFLGLTIPAGVDGPTSLKLALDHIFNHPNVGPFLALGLIRRLVTSNPSSAYVARVSAVFQNNGSGVRGDMRAVVTAILLDAEARTPPTAAFAGKQREEILRFTSWARAIEAKSPDNLWLFYIDLNQMPYRSPSVFNFFRPSYTPPQSQLAAQGFVAPEFQLTNETTVFKYIGWVEGLGYGGVNPLAANYAALAALARNSKALLDEINLIIAAGQVSDARIATFVPAIDAFDATNPDGALDKVKAAITLVMTAPEFIIIK